jgi:predicted O-linked N-acetylglucosamine transferase (SPINDLY family)
MSPRVFKFFKPKSVVNPSSNGVGSELEQARALNQQGKFVQASAICQEILKRHPDDIESLLLMAELAARSGDKVRAIQVYTKVIDLDPASALAHYKRGNLLRDGGELEAAVANYDRAVELDPGYANAFCNRGVVLADLNRLVEALASYDDAIKANPNDALTYYNRGSVFRDLKRLEEGVASLDQAIAVRPDYAEAYCNRGILLQKLKRSDEALASYDQAVALNANMPEAYFNRGGLLKALGQWEAAVASFDRAIALKPDHAEAHCDRANTLIAMKQVELAIPSYDQAFLLKPDLRFLLGTRRYMKMQLCDWREFESDVGQLVTGIEAGGVVSLPFFILALRDSAALHRKAAQIWTREEYPEDGSLPPMSKYPARDKIRIGYFSADFFDHVVAGVTAELFECHDRSRFEVTAFSSGIDTKDPMRKRLERAFDRFIDVHEKTDRDVAMLARSLGIDIAVDLGGHTSGGSTGVFALRAAPIQVNYLGYPGTMGANYMDYIISDRTIIPESHRHYYTEKVVCLPNSYLPYDSGRAISDRVITREELELPPTGFVFCCFNNSYKITPRTFDSWMRILTRVDDSVLWLAQNNPTTAGNLRREAALRGVSPERLIFANRISSLPLHLARQRMADLFLDTLPFNAHSTTMDALWAGLPVLTCVGESFAGRVAASLLTTIELPELIASTPEQFEDLAVQLASHPQRLAEIRQKLAHNKVKTPLFDTRLFATHLEVAYTKIYERYQANLSAEHMYVES